jgi:hypothetical protein
MTNRNFKRKIFRRLERLQKHTNDDLMRCDDLEHLEIRLTSAFKGLGDLEDRANEIIKMIHQINEVDKWEGK